MLIETVHTSAIAVLGVEVSLFRGVAFLPSPPIPINLDKKELIKRTAFSRNQACPDDLVGLYPDINSSNRSGPVYVLVPHSCVRCSSVCVSATLPHTTLGCTHRPWARQAYTGLSPHRRARTQTWLDGGVHHTHGHCGEAVPFVGLKNGCVTWFGRHVIEVDEWIRLIWTQSENVTEVRLPVK